jgi:hypothetical protein
VSEAGRQGGREGGREGGRGKGGRAYASGLDLLKIKGVPGIPR